MLGCAGGVAETMSPTHVPQTRPPSHPLTHPPTRLLQIITLVQRSTTSCLAIPPPHELPAGRFAGYDDYVSLMQDCWARDPKGGCLGGGAGWTWKGGLLVSWLHDLPRNRPLQQFPSPVPLREACTPSTSLAPSLLTPSFPGPPPACSPPPHGRHCHPPAHHAHQ